MMTVKQDLEEVRARLTIIKEEIEQANTDRDSLQSEVRTLGRILDIQRGMLESLRAAKGDSDKNVHYAFDCISKLHGRELYARGEAVAARMETARIRRSFSYRLGVLLVSCGRSPVGWIKAPFAILRELIRHPKSSGTDASSTEEIPPLVLSGNCSMWVPVTRKARTILADYAEGEWNIWATAHTAQEDASVTIAMQLSYTSKANAANPVNQYQRHRDLRIHRLKLRSGVPTLLLKKVSKEALLRLIRESGPFSVLRIMMLPVETESELEEFRERARLFPGAPGVRPQTLDQSLRDPADTRKEKLRNKGDPEADRMPKYASAADARDPKFSAGELEAKMWGGFAQYAIPELEQLRDDAFSQESERQQAAWALTRWFYVEEDFERALSNIAFVDQRCGKLHSHFLLAKAQCLVNQRRYKEADAVLELGMRTYGRPDFQLLRSTTAHYRELEKGNAPEQANAAQLNMLNKLFVSVGLAPIRKVKEEEALHLSNITAVARPESRVQDLKVSIIIPAYNAEDTLRWALDSLLQQTWRNLEVIVVDDLSTDDTCSLVQRISSRDDRVKLVRLGQNVGAYTARNAGLQHATGDLITVHDSDDWSHPQRLELQIEALESDSSIIATKSHWVRVSENLEIVGAWIPKGTVIDLNFSSLLFRRELLGVLGTWDEVLVSGDAEFYSRLKRIYGEAAVVKLPRQKILAFSLTRDSSLTRSRATHLRSLYYGLRGNYRDSYLHWHLRLGSHQDQLPYDPSREPRRFPVPPKNLPRAKQPDVKYDVVVISDLAMRGGAFVSTLNYIIAACKAGKKTAVFHWRRYDLARDVRLQARLYEACIDFNIDILSPGDIVDAEVVLVGYPTILQHKIDPMPEIRAKNLLIVVNQYASRLVDGQDQQYDPLRVRENLKSIFRMEGIWLPISAWVRRLMEEDDRYPVPWPSPWYPMIDADSWCTTPIQWRGSTRHVPTIGRHGRDTYTKWPAGADALAQAYGVGQEWDVRFLGGAQYATDMLGGRPANWTIIPFDEMLVDEFLRDLDFYVHYPHEKYIEEFGRGVMEAMAFGIPVILPFQFKETFGSAATYAQPEEVPKVITELWRSREQYLERAEAGRSFVRENCAMSDFPDRLSAVLDSKGLEASSAGSSTVAGH